VDEDNRLIVRIVRVPRIPARRLGDVRLTNRPEDRSRSVGIGTNKLPAMGAPLIAIVRLDGLGFRL
jgi:hypothetical protein